MTMTTSAAEPRTYGGWRRRRGVGIFGLSTWATFGLLGIVTVLILLAAFSLTALLYAAPPVLAAAAIALVQLDGESLGAAALRQARWWYGTRRGHNRYRAGIVIDHPRAFQLPGVLAATRLLSAEDGYGGHYGLVHDRRTGHLTATLKVVPASTWLANRDDADTWVANWGGWLASLGYIPMLRHATVTIETAPDPGDTLADAMAAAVDPRAPAPARSILDQLVASAPAATADVSTRVSVTFDPRACPTPPADLTEAAAEATRTLEGLESALGGCGVTVLGRASAAEIAGIVRTAFDPAARGEVGRHTARPDRQLGWADATPVDGCELRDRYLHDSGVSVAWCWHEAPRQNVACDVLARLVAPGVYPKRVTLQWRPFPAPVAVKVLESEVNAAAFRQAYRQRTGRDETARDAFDQARARQAAAEEATGAGVGLLSMFVSVTVTDEAELPRAIADTEASAESSKIRLRRMWGSQAAGFATTLPCGVCPAELARRWPN